MRDWELTLGPMEEQPALLLFRYGITKLLIVTLNL